MLTGQTLAAVGRDPAPVGDAFASTLTYDVGLSSSGGPIAQIHFGLGRDLLIRFLPRSLRIMNHQSHSVRVGPNPGPPGCAGTGHGPVHPSHRTLLGERPRGAPLHRPRPVPSRIARLVTLGPWGRPVSSFHAPCRRPEAQERRWKTQSELSRPEGKPSSHRSPCAAGGNRRRSPMLQRRLAEDRGSSRTARRRMRLFGAYAPGSRLLHRMPRRMRICVESALWVRSQ